MLAQAANLSMPLTFVDAFDCLRNPPLIPMNCVHLSWQLALLTAIEADRFPCLIAEDDAELLNVRSPAYSLPPLPSSAAFVALASNLNYSLNGRCDEEAARRNEHIVVESASHPFGFAAQYFPSKQAAQVLLDFLLRRSGPLNDHVDIASFSPRFGRSAVVCPPLLGYHAMLSDTRGEVRPSTLSGPVR